VPTAASPPAPQAGGRSTLRVALAPFALILLGGAVVGFLPYRLEVRAARHELQRKVLAVGRLKAREVASWLAAKRIEAAASSTGPMMALDVEGWLARGRIDPPRREWVAGRLDRIARSGDFAAVALLAPDGRVLLSAGEALPPGSVPAELAARAAAAGGPVMAPLRRIGDPATDALALDVVAPLTAVDAGRTRVVGALLCRIDPRRALFPLVQYWPTDSPSAEALLVTRDGDEVLFLNDLRHLRGAALRRRAPISEPELISARGLRGARGLQEGLDYRGVPVLAHVEEIEGTAWLLVSKVDQAEVYAPLRDYLWIYLAFVTLAGVAAGASARVRVRREREEGLRREHEATVRYVTALEAAREERERLIASLTKALDDVKTLRGIVPICAHCKRVRDDAGFWSQVEAYVSRHTEAQFSHGLCPDCAAKLYPGLMTPPPDPRR
jgi:hypothetical protein